MDEFKKIARWEIDLRREIHVDRHLKALSRGRAAACVHRVFSAKVQNNDSKSVILYEGETAEEECREYISRHANTWHPNVLQIFGLSSFGGQHAVIAQDDLVPHTEYLAFHRPSFILEAYLYVCWIADFTDLREFRPQSTPNLALWIRSSTGRLCLEFESRKMIHPPVWMSASRISNTTACIDWNDPTWETRATEILSLDQFHYICFRNFARYRIFAVEADKVADIRLGTLLFGWSESIELEDYTEIARLPSAEFELGWGLFDTWNVTPHPCDNGWTRFNSMDVYGQTMTWSVHHTGRDSSCSWMCQANSMFNKLGITSGLEKFVFIYGVAFNIEVASPSTNESPAREGYIFLCPVSHLRPAPGSVSWPECPYFWSMDPTGVERLSADDAAAHGFPTVELRTQFRSEYWDGTAYEGMRKLHELKGHPLGIKGTLMFEIFWDNVEAAGLKYDPGQVAAALKHDAPDDESIPTTDSSLVPWWKWNLSEFGSLC
ncbi:hypothetical protein FB45DRAFT_1060000 [Roridomyces roridus]|uniref:Uncharacterized protein n=1 Tax=Roridomyces roridus TaxID=1738132 RepID=A0AAD7BQT9_9AGAR|nr:hypothetical protein FB45DRAFT_1060000 [Roridomyces roridus]